MPAVEIDSPEQYSKAFDVLTQVGGTFHGVGGEKRSLLVTEAQYEAFVAAGVAKRNGTKERSRGTKKTPRGVANARKPGNGEDAKVRTSPQADNLRAQEEEQMVSLGQASAPGGARGQGGG